MDLNVACACGKVLRAPARLAGRRVRCPGCGAILALPGAPAVPFVAGPAGPTAPPTESRAAPLAVWSAPAATAAPIMVPAVPAPLQTSPRRDFRYWLLLLALLPLAWLLLSAGKDDTRARMEKTIQEASPEVQQRLAQIVISASASDEDFFDALPGGQIQGAHLPRRTWQHWGYAVIAAAGFLLLLIFIFPQGNATARSLLLVGLFTGTLGILFLLAVQFLAAWTQGLWIRGRGIVTLIFYVLKFIGYSYRSALDPESNFLLSFMGFTCGVGLCEELVKALPLFRHFRGRATLDWRGACLWGLASGVGFGVSEGITYAADFYNGLATGGIYAVRFVSCVALHAIWGGGVGITIYRHQARLRGAQEWFESALTMLRLILVAMVLHGLYDTLLKKDMQALALLSALATFAWLAWLIERQRRAEQSGLPVAA